MRSCRDISELLSRSLDTQLSWRERWALRTHLLMCRACATLASQMTFLRQVGRLSGDPEGPLMAGADEADGLDEAARARIRERLRRAGAPEGEG